MFVGIMSAVVPWGVGTEDVRIRKVYRFSELGSSLNSALTKMVQEGKITEEQKELVMLKFDNVGYSFCILYCSRCRKN